ncbi:MAG: DJ-1/PfpI family protein [Lachnospiraceae bacterium]|nr:DJ-1/PfpI family protein [Lachnospiraceae bacterium]
MSRVFVMLADGFEECEGLIVVDLLRRAGVDCITMSIKDSKEITSSHKVTLFADEALDEELLKTGDMIVLPGGMPGTLNLEASDAVQAAVRDYVAKDKYIAAICAAPTVFGHMGLLQGKKACCYGGMEEGLVGAEVTYDKVTIDGKIITSRGLGTALDFGYALIGILNSEAQAMEIKAKIMA